MNSLTTRFTTKATLLDPLPDYPRPHLVRDSYLNLNGWWDYAISKMETFQHSDGKILVPFSPESANSGVLKQLLPGEYLYYHRVIQIPEGFMKDRLLLHFGAVDQVCDLWINEQYVGNHVGGFLPFSFDITPFLQENEVAILLRVQDASDTLGHQTGKQRLQSGGIFYTSQSGIWQTVWMESVPHDYIEYLQIEPQYDQSSVKIALKVSHPLETEITVSYQNKVDISFLTLESSVVLPVRYFYPWTPDLPRLYDVHIRYGNDVIRSYFGMRKMERTTDANGIQRVYLNQEALFCNGVLDQGYYPESLLTPPSDEAMIHDIMQMKELGFNLLRKHIKIEPARFYYHCDRLGMLVWQDVVSGSRRHDIFFHGALALANIHLPDRWYGLFGRKNQADRNQFEVEFKDTIHHLSHFPSIMTWVIFNEAWGQFDSKRLTKQLRTWDPSRLIDHASGWSDQGVGDYVSRHIYFKKIKVKPKNGRSRILALTEFGGYSFPVEGHLFNPNRLFGYKTFHTADALHEALEALYKKEIIPSIQKGLSVLIYTQLSDVEEEVNGFLTYDREILKVKRDWMRTLNLLCHQVFMDSITED